jgi:hypothetical protein
MNLPDEFMTYKPVAGRKWVRHVGHYRVELYAPRVQVRIEPRLIQLRPAFKSAAILVLDRRHGGFYVCAALMLFGFGVGVDYMRPWSEIGRRIGLTEPQ